MFDAQSWRGYIGARPVEAEVSATLITHTMIEAFVQVSAVLGCGAWIVKIVWQEWHLLWDSS